MKNLENSRENKVSNKDNLMEIDRVGFNQEKKKERLKEVDQNMCRSITISGESGIDTKVGNLEDVRKEK